MTFLISVNTDIQCTTWPNSSKYGCTGGGEWVPLDKATFGTAECESLCIRHALSEGCCIVGQDFGCYWKGGAKAVTSPTPLSASSSNCTIFSEFYFIISIQLKRFFRNFIDAYFFLNFG